MSILNAKKDIDVIGVQIDFGASQKGVAMGPLAIRYAGLSQDLRKLGYSVRDKGDIIPPPDGMSLRHMIKFEQVNETNRQLYEKLLKHYIKQDFINGYKFDNDGVIIFLKPKRKKLKFKGIKKLTKDGR